MTIDDATATPPTTEDDYLAKRTLRSGSAGWLLLAGLGISYVISGDFSGWNFGIAEGGPVAAGWTLAAFCAFMLYFALYSRHRLVASSPDEEFAVLARAEEDLE